MSEQNNCRVDGIIKRQRKDKLREQEEAEIAAIKAGVYKWRMPILVALAGAMAIGSSWFYGQFLDSSARYSRAPLVSVRAQPDDKLDDLTRRFTSDTNHREFDRELRRYQFIADNNYTNDLNADVPTNYLFKVRDVRSIK
jgi:hypothetical protein